ncbi:MAG: NADH-quinone oxidoreductase subunit NuoE [Gammaproteobacteria bacterium]
MTEQTTNLISADIREKIAAWNLRYPPEQKRSGVFEALRLVQERNGYLTTELMDAVADFLEMPKVAVYEVATFYTMYYLSPVGEHVINVCTNISCSLNGAEAVLEHLKQKLGIDLNETTPDGKFTLKEVECLGACVTAPVCQIDKQYHVNLSPEKIDDILAALGGKHDG